MLLKHPLKIFIEFGFISFYACNISSAFFFFHVSQWKTSVRAVGCVFQAFLSETLRDIKYILQNRSNVQTNYPESTPNICMLVA